MVMKKDEIISEEIITPSSPTPHHLKNLKLSFLDQIAPPLYIPLILFYDHHSDKTIDRSKMSSLLKKSLADILTSYYPLAGTLKENSSWIDCDDVGVQYYESRVTSKLSEVIQNPNPEELQHFLPFGAYSNEPTGLERKVLLAVKANFFECGGLAIGVCVSHHVADGTSAFTFLNDWAATCSCGTTDHHDKEVVAVCPIFDAASYFPPKEGLTVKRNINNKDATENKIVRKRFVFDKSKITALKQEATGSEVKNPTRVEAVSAFIWQRIMAIARSKSSTQKQAKVMAATHAVNLRPRMDPPLPTSSIANLWWCAVITPPPSTTTVDAVDQKEEYRSLVSQMRNVIKKVDVDCIKKLQSEDEQINVLKNMGGQLSRGEIELCSFTSWCRFPMYEVDFGWGKPTWVNSPIRLYKNMVMMMSTKDGGGIEAWVNLVDEDMALFERDAKLLSFVSSPAPTSVDDLI